MSEVIQRKSTRRGEIATVYFISTVGSGPMYVDRGDQILVLDKINAFRLQKKDGRAYLIPYSSVAFVRFEPGSVEEPVEESEDGSETT